jgi:hypothetical protein
MFSYVLNDVGGLGVDPTATPIQFPQMSDDLSPVAPIVGTASILNNTISITSSTLTSFLGFGSGPGISSPALSSFQVPSGSASSGSDIVEHLNHAGSDEAEHDITEFESETLHGDHANPNNRNNLIHVNRNRNRSKQWHSSHHSSYHADPSQRQYHDENTVLNTTTTRPPRGHRAQRHQIQIQIQHGSSFLRIEDGSGCGITSSSRSMASKNHDDLDPSSPSNSTGSQIQIREMPRSVGLRRGGFVIRNVNEADLISQFRKLNAGRRQGEGKGNDEEELIIDIHEESGKRLL